MDILDFLEPEEVEQNSYRWIVLAMSFLMLFFGLGFLQFSIPILSPLIEADLGISPALGMTIYSAIMFSLIFTNIIGGVIGDQYPLKWVVGTGGIIAGISGIIRWFAPSYMGLLAASLIHGLAIGLFYPNIVKILTQWFSPVQLGLAQGVNMTGSRLGGGVAQAISAGLMVGLLGTWQNVFLLYGIITIGIAVCWILFVRSPEPEEEPVTPDHLIPGEKTSAPEASSDESVTGVLRRLLRLPVVYLLGAIALLTFYRGIGFSGIFPTLADKMPLHVPDIAIASILFSSIIGALTLPALSDKIGRKKVLYVAIAGSMIGIPIIVNSPSLPILFGGVILYGISFGGFFPILLTFLGEHPKIGGARAGTVSGLMYSFGQIGGAIGPTAAGWILETSNFYLTAYMLVLPTLAVFPLVWMIEIE